MIGNFEVSTNDLRYRDKMEYTAMVMLAQVLPDLKNQGVHVMPSTMQKFRDNWTQNGQRIDFTTMTAVVEDFERLVRLTGATSFGKLSSSGSLSQGIKEMMELCDQDYEKSAATGNYIHVITDPEIREHVLSQANEPVAKAFFIHPGRSLRSMNPGQEVTLYDRTFSGYQFISQIAGAEATVNPEPEPLYDIERYNDEGRLLGWQGGEQNGFQYRGLSHIIGAYVTKADAEIIAKNIDPNTFFNGNIAEKSAQLLQHMRSNGYDFSVRTDANPNQIEVRMAAGQNINVRVFDPESDGTYIGRVYDTYNKYYYNIQGFQDVKNSQQITAEDSIALLDYIMGNRAGKTVKSISRESSRVQLRGIDSRKTVQIMPVANRYRSLSFINAEEARFYIESAITDAQHVVEEQFRADDLQALIDQGLDDKDTPITDPDFQAKLDVLYSNDMTIREAQEHVGQLAIHSSDGGREFIASIQNSIVGNYESGFNPAFVIDHMQQTGRGNEREAMLSALKIAGYDLNLIKGNDFAANAIRERMVTFDSSTAKSIHEVDHPMIKDALTTVSSALKESGLLGEANNYRSEPTVLIDGQGVISWEAYRRLASKKEAQWELIRGEIGQVMVPDEHGIISTSFNSGNNYGLVPSYTGYFTFDGNYNNRMERFRVKGFEQHLTEQLSAQVTHQVTRPYDKVLGNIPTTLDASALNGLYHGDVYGKRIELDFMETSQLNDETKKAILKTLSNRVRFDNQYSDYATTSAETQAKRELDYPDQTPNDSAFSYWKAAGEKNMRVLDRDLSNYADLTMTGTGKTQGLVWYLTDGAEVKAGGSVTPSKGIKLEDGSLIPDKTALQKLSYFDNKSFNAWDRNQMSSNQLMTALRVDEGVNTALMSFGGWTFDDSYAVSKEFADRNQIFGSEANKESMDILRTVIAHVADGGDKHDILEGTGMVWTDDIIDLGVKGFLEQEDVSLDAILETYGKFRSLQRGDKLSDFGGNKGTIGIVIDRYMSREEAKEKNLTKEVDFLWTNPDLDVISAPYSMLSRHNAGVVKELMDGEPQDLMDPATGEIFKGAMGKLNIIVTDMKVDEKTHAYTREDVLAGKGRKASGQLAWALQSKGATGILNEIYGRNDAAWSTYREYLITTGLDMLPDGTIVNGYHPHADEQRNHFEYEPYVSAPEFLDQIKEQGGFLDLPFDVSFKNGTTTNELPVLSASLRQNTELIDGSIRRSDFTNYYANIYQAVADYTNAEKEVGREKAHIKAQGYFDKIQATIIDRQFDGGHSGKHSFIRDKIMGKKQQNSATGVMIVDPRLKIGEAAMNQKMLNALDAKEGDTLMMFRDPVWRDGAIRAVTAVLDESVHGVAINPIADKSHDADFDGDTAGLMKFTSKEAIHDLETKFSHWANMIDHGNGKNELYFQKGMDLASGEAAAATKGDTLPKELYEKAHKNAMSSNPKLLKQSLRDLTEYTQQTFRKYGFGSDYVSLDSDKTVYHSFKKMVDNRAKGSPEKLEEYMKYHMGKKTDWDARHIQYATGVKSDDTGLAGAFSQKLVATMRNQNITAALESMYPLTQGTLQIKHDASHARVVNEILTEDMNKLFRAKDLQDPQRRALTPHRFKEQLTDIMHNKMGVSINEKFIDTIVETLSDKGRIIPLKDAMVKKGSPMDRVAYGGGYEELKRLAEKGESLLDGEQNKLFAPFSMRYANEQTKIVKKDTQSVRTIISAPSIAAVQPVVRREEDTGFAL